MKITIIDGDRTMLVCRARSLSNPVATDWVEKASRTFARPVRVCKHYEKCLNAQDAIDRDPDMDLVGTVLENTKRVFIDEHGEVISHSTDFREKNWEFRLSKKFSSVSKLASKYVFCKHYQLIHHDGLSFEYLHGLASGLSKKCQMMISKGKIIVQKNGLGYHAALEGVSSNQSYGLIMHLTNQELRCE